MVFEIYADPFRYFLSCEIDQIVTLLSLYPWMSVWYCLFGFLWKSSKLSCISNFLLLKHVLIASYRIEQDLSQLSLVVKHEFCRWISHVLRTFVSIPSTICLKLFFFLFMFRFASELTPRESKQEDIMDHWCMDIFQFFIFSTFMHTNEMNYKLVVFVCTLLWNFSSQLPRLWPNFEKHFTNLAIRISSATIYIW